MRKIAVLGFVAVAFLPGLALAQVRQFRFYLTYQDPMLIALARASGADVTAALGKEIPSDRYLNVPAASSFRVGLEFQHISNGEGDVYVKDCISFIAYDRAELTNVSYLAAPPLDNYSFRKVAPMFTTESSLSMNLENFGGGSAYDLNRDPIDENNDGIPDQATYFASSSLGVGGYVLGSDDTRQVRPVGTSYAIRPLYRRSNGTSALGWLKVQPGERHRICTSVYTNSLQVGEPYGSRTGETGLLLHTTGGEQTGQSNNLGYPRNSGFNPEPWQNIGAKYTLMGAAPVPEPGGMVGLLAGLAMLIRRRG
ncbi:MAG: PEP-CTERM sorting domain-containing protein [Chthonomonas sp.]|nr:PEP-CTERM sorting domain-containing protein [Chthonomonas sp.]